MKAIIDNINKADWHLVTEEMHQNGYAIVPKLLSDEQCEVLKANYDNSNFYCF